jgi:hypothetical protein
MECDSQRYSDLGDRSATVGSEGFIYLSPFLDSLSSADGLSGRRCALTGERGEDKLKAEDDQDEVQTIRSIEIWSLQVLPPAAGFLENCSATICRI